MHDKNRAIDEGERLKKKKKLKGVVGVSIKGRFECFIGNASRVVVVWRWGAPQNNAKTLAGGRFDRLQRPPCDVLNSIMVSRG